MFSFLSWFFTFVVAFLQVISFYKIKLVAEPMISTDLVKLISRTVFGTCKVKYITAKFPPNQILENICKIYPWWNFRTIERLYTVLHDLTGENVRVSLFRGFPLCWVQDTCEIDFTFPVLSLHDIASFQEKNCQLRWRGVGWKRYAWVSADIYIFVNCCCPSLLFYNVL